MHKSASIAMGVLACTIAACSNTGQAPTQPETSQATTTSAAVAPKPTGVPITGKDISNVTTYYSQRFIGGGWSVGQFKPRGKNIVAELRLSSNEQACAFRNDPAARQDLAFSLACPYEGDYIWQELNTDQDITIEVSCDGTVFYKGSCRSIGRTGSIVPIP